MFVGTFELLTLGFWVSLLFQSVTPLTPEPRAAVPGDAGRLPPVPGSAALAAPPQPGRPLRHAARVRPPGPGADGGRGGGEPGLLQRGGGHRRHHAEDHVPRSRGHHGAGRAAFVPFIPLKEH